MKRKDGGADGRDVRLAADGTSPGRLPVPAALDEFRRAGEASPLLKRMSELISLLDLTTTLNSGAAPARRSSTRRCSS